jgi:hypothetical protein
MTLYSHRTLEILEFLASRFDGGKAMASRAKRKWRYRQNGIHSAFKKEPASTGVWNGEKPVSHSADEQKMSTVLLDFVSPYTATAESEAEFRTAIQIGVIAWNIALLAPDVRQEQVESLIQEAVLTGADDFVESINEMVGRKEHYFGDCRRYILAHRVEITRRGPSLSVISAAK